MGAPRLAVSTPPAAPVSRKLGQNTEMLDAMIRTALAALPPADAAAIEAELRAAVTSGLAAARARWPEVVEAIDARGAPQDASAPSEAALAFARLLGAKLAGAPRLASTLPRLRVEDLLLAWWAVRDPERGIPALWATYADELERLVARFHRLDREELMQALRIKLFVAAEGAPPRLSTYNGFGYLLNWLRVLATRTFLDAARALARRRSTGLEEAGHDDDAPLLALIVEPTAAIGARDRERVRTAIRAAFAASVAGLPPRERTFLRLATVDGLTLEQIAATYQLGRATVARALASGRARLRDDTRRGMIEALGISPDELDSVIRSLDTQLELSLARVLAMHPSNAGV
jgi:RNA polymerase sigma-70 factor